MFFFNLNSFVPYQFIYFHFYIYIVSLRAILSSIFFPVFIVV